MSITITGGISFSGGVGIVAPPLVATAGWFGGGRSPSKTSIVDRITYATDTATASVRGPLSDSTLGVTGVGTFTYGWFGGGNNPAGPQSTVCRITYTTDTATASVRGPLSSAKRYMGSAGNDNYGWFGGGLNIVSPQYLSTVDRITYATDTDTASVRGPLSIGRSQLAASGNTINGWFGGGYSPSGPGSMSTVNRITYATDTDVASVRGPLSSTKYGLAAAGNTTDGWFGGGVNPALFPASVLSRVDRITYSTDTVTASVRGPLSVARFNLAASSNDTDAWFGGGYNSGAGGLQSTVDRITFATDTATASVRGPLSLARERVGASSGIQ